MTAKPVPKAQSAETRLSAHVAGHLQSIILPSDQSITSTSHATVCSCPVNAGTYRITASSRCTNGGVNATQHMGFDGPAFSTSRINYHYLSPVSVNAQYGEIPMNGDVGVNPGGGGNAWHIFFEGVVVFTASGTLSLIAYEGSAGNSFTVNALTFMDAFPVT